MIDIIDSPPMFEKLRLNNSFIMEEFIKASVNPDDMYILNIIQMHLQAVTLSDITSADRQSIMFNSWMAGEENTEWMLIKYQQNTVLGFLGVDDHTIGWWSPYRLTLIFN